jgi:AbiV family abortive infection protein
MPQHISTFISLSPAECALVYPEIMANANAHFEVAAILAEKEHYSNAIAHSILGFEELVKGLVLFLDSKDFKLRPNIPDIKRLFNYHSAKHL